jgi:hypothetical protein
MWRIEYLDNAGSFGSFHRDGGVATWATAEDADGQAERLWLKYVDTERYDRISVVNVESGVIYSDWEF